MLKILLLILIALLGWIYLYRNFKKLDVTAMLLISYLLFFDIYTLIVFLKLDMPENDTVFIFTNIYLFFSVFAVLFAVKILVKRKYLENIEFSNMLDQASTVSGKTVFYLFIITAIFLLYYFFRYGVLFRVPLEYMSIDILNAYGIIMASFVLPIYYVLLIISISKYFVHSKRVYKLLYLLLIITILSYLFFYSRREFILGIMIIVLLISVKQSNNIFTYKKIPRVLFLLFVVILASNLYQNIRNPLMLYSITKELKFEKSFIEYALDFESSSNNINDRLAISYFAYMVIDKSLVSSEVPLGGRLFSQNITNAIPSIVYPDKKYITEDELIADILNIRHKDYPTNMAISFFMDFWYFALFLFPLFLFAVIYVSLLIINIIYYNNLLYIMVMGELIYLLYNVENSISDVFLYFRNIFILILVMKLFHIFRHLTYKKKITRLMN